MRRTWQAAVLHTAGGLCIMTMGCADLSTGPHREQSEILAQLPEAKSEATGQTAPLPVLTGAAAESFLRQAAASAPPERRAAIDQRLTRMARARTNALFGGGDGVAVEGDDSASGPFGAATIHETNTMVGLEGSFSGDAPSYVSPHIRYSGSRAKVNTKFRLANRGTDSEILSLELEHEGVGDVECWRFIQCDRTIYSLTPVIPIGNTRLCGVKLSGGSKYQAWIEFPPFGISPVRGISLGTIRWGRAESADVADPDPGIPCRDDEDPGDGGGGGGGGDSERTTQICIEVIEGWYDPFSDAFGIDDVYYGCWTFDGPISSFESRPGFAPASSASSRGGRRGGRRGGAPREQRAHSVMLLGTTSLPGRVRTQVHRFVGGAHPVVIAVDTSTATTDDVAAAVAGLAALDDDPVGRDGKDQKVRVRSFSLGTSLPGTERSTIAATLRSLSRAPVTSIRGVGTGRAIELTVSSAGRGRRSTP